MHFKYFKCIFHYRRTPVVVTYFSISTKMEAWVVRNKKISSAELRSIWKAKKYLILEKHVKTTNFKQNLIGRYYKEQKYIQLILAIVLSLYGRFIGNQDTVTQFMWHYYVITLIRFLKCHQFPRGRGRTALSQNYGSTAVATRLPTKYNGSTTAKHASVFISVEQWLSSSFLSIFLDHFIERQLLRSMAVNDMDAWKYQLTEYQLFYHG